MLELLHFVIIFMVNYLTTVFSIDLSGGLGLEVGVLEYGIVEVYIHNCVAFCLQQPIPVYYNND